MEIYDRIREIRNHFFKGSNSSFAEFMGEKTATTSGWISGKRGVGKNVIDKIISKFPQINAHWLLTGEGKMINTYKEDTQEAILIELNEPSGEFIRESNNVKYYDIGNGLYRMTVPFVPYNAYGRFANESDSLEADRDEWETIDFIVDKQGHGKYYSFEVKGESMDDGTRTSFEEHDKLLVRELDRVHWKDGLRYNKYPFWVIVFDNSVLIKQIIDQDLETGDIVCHSLNQSPEYSDFTINLDDVKRLFNVLQKIPKIVKY